MGRLGTEYAWADLPDAPWRNPYYRSFRTIVLGRHPSDLRFLRRVVSPTIRDLLKRFRPRWVYAPLAVGTHIDHRLTFEAARRAVRGRLRFYEDRPYVLLPGNLQIRLSELGWRPRVPIPRISETEFLAGLEQTAYVRTFLGMLKRKASVSELLRRLGRRGGRVKLRSQKIRGDALVLDRVCGIVNEYESQNAALFDGKYRESARAYAAEIGGGEYAERCWSLLMPPRKGHSTPPEARLGRRRSR